MTDLDFTMNGNTSNVGDYELYLQNILDDKNRTIKSQNQRISQLKELVAKDLERIEQLDKALPMEEGKITELISRYNNLQNRFQSLQNELNCYINNEDQYKMAMENADKQILEINAKQKSIEYQINQSKIQQTNLNQNINTLTNSYRILSNDNKRQNINAQQNQNVSLNPNMNSLTNSYRILANDNNNQNQNVSLNQIQMDQIKLNYLIKRQEDIDLQNKKLEKKKQAFKRDTEIEQYKNQNLKTQLEIYNLLKQKYELVKTKRELQKINETSSKMTQAQKELQDKNIILKDEKQKFNDYEKELQKTKSEFNYEKRKIHHLKSLINKVDEQINQENTMLEYMKQQYLASMISSSQLSAKLNQANQKISELRGEKSLMKKELEIAKCRASVLQNKIDTDNQVNNESLDDIYSVMNDVKGSYENINQQIQEMKNKVRRLQSKTPDSMPINISNPKYQSRTNLFNPKPSASRNKNDDYKIDPHFLQPNRRYEPY